MEKQYYNDIHISTIGIVFMGTPHKGAKIAGFAAVGGWIINSILLLRIMNIRLLNLLSPDSPALAEIAKKFEPSSGPPLMIKSFIETNDFPGLGSLVSAYPRINKVLS